MKKTLFIGSSSESVEIAAAIYKSLKDDFKCSIWKDAFNFSKTTIENLENALNKYDYAIFVFQPDDKTILRGEKVDTVRDNLIFELGLFIGKLGRSNVSYIVPRSYTGMHLPTDLLGITHGEFDDESSDLFSSVFSYCVDFKNQVLNNLPAGFFKGKWVKHHSYKKEDGEEISGEELFTVNDNDEYILEDNLVAFKFKDFRKSTSHVEFNLERINRYKEVLETKLEIINSKHLKGFECSDYLKNIVSNKINVEYKKK